MGADGADRCGWHGDYLKRVVENFVTHCNPLACSSSSPVNLLPSLSHHLAACSSLKCSPKYIKSKIYQYRKYQPTLEQNGGHTQQWCLTFFDACSDLTVGLFAAQSNFININ